MNLAPLLLMVGIFALMWALVLRPQQQRVRQHRALVESLRPGDEVITTGGLLGTLVEVDAEVVVLEAAEGVRLRVARAAVGQRLDGSTGEIDEAGGEAPHQADEHR